MNAHVETRLRPAIPRWGRVVLALLASAGIAVLANLRPVLPWTPWQAIQPTAGDLVRQSIACIAWLTLFGICLRLGWLAIKPPRRLETVTHTAPRWLPEPRRTRVTPLRSDSRELLRLFVRPQTVSGSAAAAATSESSATATLAPAVTTSTAGEGRVRVRLVGRLGVNGNGPSERATRGLIAYLVLKRAPATMDELVEALWPGENPAKTRQRLWKAKRQAQRLLGDPLVRQHDSYVVDRSRLRTDIDELDELRSVDTVEAVELDRLAALTDEEPLADVDYPWADGERRRLQAIQAELIAEGAEARLANGEGSAALAAAERLIRLDPLNERGWCLAMQAEGALGNRQAILDRYDRLSRQLDERLGLKPGAHAKETYRRLLSQT